MKDWTEELFMNLPEPEAGEIPPPVYPFTGTPQDAQERTKQGEDGGQDIINREGPGTPSQDAQSEENDPRKRGRKPGGHNSRPLRKSAPKKPPVLSPEEKMIKEAQDRIAPKIEKDRPKKGNQGKRYNSPEESKAARKKYLLNYTKKNQVNIQVRFSASNDQDILEHLRKQPNKTNYFRQLILADMIAQSKAEASKKPI